MDVSASYSDLFFQEEFELSFGQQIIRNISKVKSALDLEPEIKPSFAAAGITTIIRIMFAAMMIRAYDAASLYDYLKGRGCSFDRETIDFLLNNYEGNDATRHLWRRGSLGEYNPLSEVFGH